MAADGMSYWRTSIAQVVSNETEEEILIRGRKLSDLVGSVTFAQMMFLLQRYLPSSFFYKSKKT